tara:strand:+ start:888 stop:1949 length:1062 start_codon:yes stop_codon:yes gene_type:complete
MRNLNLKHLEDLRIAQIIDANLDRAREGLRVLEDWARFALGRKDLVKSFKNFRQILGKHHLKIYKESRNFINDNCMGLSHPEQLKRNNTSSIISSNAGRVQEALRVIEEFSREHNQILCNISSEIRYQIYSLEILLLEAQANNSLLKILNENNLYFITLDTENLLEKIKDILEGGVKIIQLRCKDGKDADILKFAIKVRALCNRFGAIFLINDRVDIALASKADGVHLGQTDMDIKSARNILGFSKLIGVSASNARDIKKAIKDGCDYLGIGPVFATTTKKRKVPLGIDTLKSLTKEISIPWFAIGGIKLESIPLLKENNIRKVAIITDLINSKKPKDKAIMLINALNNENYS